MRNQIISVIDGNGGGRERDRERERERERDAKLHGNPRNVNRFNVEILLKIFKVIKVQKSKIYFTNRFDFFMYSCTALKLLRLASITRELIIDSIKTLFWAETNMFGSVQFVSP